MSNIVFELFAKLGLDSSEYEKGLNNAKNDATSIGGKIAGGLKSVAKIGAAALGTATTAVGAFAASSVKVGETFDKSMSQVAATMGFTVDELNKDGSEAQQTMQTLNQFAQEMGRTTAFSASQAADALNYMALAGYDAETSMQMLPNVLNLAAAGNMELARASDMVTDTQTAFGITLERTSQMVDEMAKAASTGNTSVEQLGEAFLTVGGLAQELNGGMVVLSDGTTATYDNVQELEIALTAMANAGIKGSEAGTHMRNMLLKLASPTADGTKAFKQLGVEVFDAEGNMRSIAGIMEDLDGAMANLTQEEKLQAISDIFNTRDTAAAEALMNAMGEDWASIAESILDADGAAEQMAKTQLDNLAGDITLFKSALEGAQIAISDELSPSLRDFVKFGTDGLSSITQAFKEGGLSGAISAFGTILSDGLTMIIGKVPEFISAGMQLLSALGKGLMDNIDVILFAVGDVVEMVMNGLLEATSGQSSIIMEIIDWIVGVFNENYGNLIDVGFQIIENIVTGIANAFPQVLSTIVEFVGLIAQKLISNIPTMVKAAVELAKGLAQGLLQAIPLLVSMVPELITSMIDAAIEAVPMLIDGVIELVNGLVENLPTIIQALIEAIPLIIESYVNGLVTYLPILVQGAIRLMDALVAATPEIIMALVDAIPTILETLATSIIENAPILIAAVLEAMITLGAHILEYGAMFLDYVGQIMSNIIEAVSTWLQQLPEKMAYYAGYAIGQFIAFFINLPSNLMNLLNTVISNVVTFGTSLKEKAIESGKNFFNGLIDNLKALPSRMMQLGLQLVKAVANLPSKFLEIGKNIVKGLWEGISNAWAWLTEKVGGLFGNLVRGIKDGLGIESPSKVFAEIGKYVDEGYAKGIVDNMDVIDKAMAGLESVSVNPEISSSSIANSSMQNDIIRLLEEIAANKEIHVTFEGGLDRFFRAIQIESQRNKQITGQESFA